MAAYPNEERDPARGFSMNIQPAVPAPVPRVANPSMAQPDVAQVNASIANAVTPAPAQPGGAVFGFYPNVAGGSNRVSYAADTALRTGVEAAPGGGFQPAAPSAVAPGLRRDLPQGVEPSVAGSGRGFVNPAPAVAPAVAVAPAPVVASSVVRQSPAAAASPVGAAPRAPAGFIEKTITSDPNPALVGKVTRTGVAPRGFPGGTEPGGPGTVTMIAPQGGYVTQPVAEPLNPVLASTGFSSSDPNAALREAVLAKAAQNREVQRVGMGFTQAQTGEVQARTAQTNVTTEGARGMQSATAAYEKALESGDPKQIQKAEERLRARQGKYEKETPDVFDKVQVGVDPTSGAPIFQIYSKRTGKAATEQPAGATPASKGISKDAYAKLPNGAQYVGSDGKTYVKREAQPKG